MKPIARENITIPISTYNELLRASERNTVVKEYIENTSYPSVDDIKVILGIKDGENNVQN